MRIITEKSAKLLFIVLAILLVDCSKSWAIESVSAKTQKPADAQENVVIQPPMGENTAQTDGMEIKNPIEVVKERIRTKNTVEENKTTQKKEGGSILVDADEMEYQEETKEVEARGNVVVIAKPDNVKITAKRGTLNHGTNILKLYDDVVVYKDGAEIQGKYMVVDLNEENVLMDEPIATYGMIKVTSREGYAYANKIESINGQVELVKKMDIMLATQGFGSHYDNTIVQKDLATDEIKKKRAEPYRIHTKEITIRSDKEHDIVTLKNSQIFYKSRKILTTPTIQLYTDKEHNYIETNIMEIGGLRDFGTYIGPAFLTKGPFGSTFKIAPILASSDKMGAGAIVKFRSKRNIADFGWNSGSDNFIIRGKYIINKDLKIEYARHAYMDEWFHGHRRPGYGAQLSHRKTWAVPNLDAQYTQMLSAAYITEYFKEKQEDHLSGAGRFRWQAELAKNLFSMGNKEQEMFMDLKAVAQTSATLYTTGEAVGMVKLGPRIQSRIKNWGSRIHLAMGGIHGESPYEFDRYRYGKLSITVDQNYRFNRYLTAGYYGTFTPLKDNFEKKMVTENRFYVIAGPEDVKVAVFYDTERSLAAFDIMFLLGSNNLKTTYDKLTVENYEKIGKKHTRFEDFKLGRIKVPKEAPAQQESNEKLKKDSVDPGFVEYDPYNL